VIFIFKGADAAWTACWVTWIIAMAYLAGGENPMEVFYVGNTMGKEGASSVSCNLFLSLLLHEARSIGQGMLHSIK
jgi:hypothetical protein